MPPQFSLGGLLLAGRINALLVLTGILARLELHYNASVSMADSYGWYNVNGAWVYEDADVDDNDGLQSISVTSDNESNVFYIMLSKPP